MHRLQSVRIKLILLSIGACLLFSCSKDPQLIQDVEIDELQSSYLVLSENTVDIDQAFVEDNLQEKTDDRLVFQSSEKFNNLKVGGHIVSDIQTPSENIIFRKIVSIIDDGQIITFETERPRVLEAFDEYYINSQLNGLIQTRSGYSIRGLIGSILGVTNAIINSGSIENFVFEIDLKVNGNVDFELAHPNTAWKFSCDCSPDKTDLNQDGIWDEAYNNLGLLEIDEVDMQTLEEVGVYNLKINQFNLEEFGLKLKYGVFETIDETTDVDELFSKLTSPATVVTENDDETDKLNLNYYPIPGATAYVFGLDFVLTPVVELNCEWAGQTGVSIKFPNYVDIRLATFNFDDGLPLPRESRIQFFQANKKVSGAVVFENWSISFTQGLSGSAELVTGVKLGLAVSVGKADVAGTAIGAYVTFGKSFKLSGEGVMSLAGLSLSNPDVDLSFAGQLCFSTAFGFLNGSVFVDDNPLNFIDSELNIPLPFNVDILSVLDDYDPLSGICVSLDQCSDILLDTLIAIDIGNQEALVRFNASNDDIGNRYNLRLYTDDESYLLTGVGNTGYTFNVTNLDELVNVTPSFLEALKTKSYEVDVISAGLNCSKSFEASGAVFYSNCVSPFLDFKNSDSQSDPIGVHATNTFGEVISYAKFVDIYGFGLENSLLTLDQTKTLIDGTAFNNCHNPSGFYHDKEMSKQLGSIQNSYVWISTGSDDENNLLEVIPVFSSGKLSFEYKTHPYSANTYATLLK